MLGKSLRATIKSKVDEVKRRWRRASTLGKIKMCLFNYFVFSFLAFCTVACISEPDLNNYVIPLFLLTAVDGAMYDPSDYTSDEPLIKVIGKNIAYIILGIFFTIGFFIAFL